jgi:hypothetical protein
MSAGVVASNPHQRGSRIEGEEIQMGMRGGLMGMGMEREEIHGRTAEIMGKDKGKGKGQGHRVKEFDSG